MAALGDGNGSGEPADEQGSLSRGRLRDATLTGVRWVTIAKLAADVVTFGSAIVLAHLISPSEFGRAAVAMVLFLFSTVFTGYSFGTPLVQRKQIDHEYVQASWLLSVVAGLALTALTLALAPVVAAPLFGADVGDLMQVLAPLFAISGLGVVPHALLQRELAFKRISMMELASIVAGAATSVALAIAGLQAEAIVLGAVAKSLVFTTLLCVAAPKALPRWHGDRIREIFAFGFPTALQGFVSNANRNVDYAILGATMSPAQVGFYWRAFQLGVEYERKITVITSRLALPVFSRARELADMRRIRTRMVRANATVIFPVIGTFVVVAPVFIPWAFGAQWEPAVLPAQILALAGMSGAVNAGGPPLVLAAGRPKALLTLSLVFLGGYAIAILLASGQGLVAVCVVATVAHLLRGWALHYFLLDRIVGVPIRDLWGDLAPALAGTVALVAAGAPLAALLSDAGTPAVPFVAAVGTVCVAVYVAVVCSAFPAARGDIALLAGRILPARLIAALSAPLRARAAFSARHGG